MKGKTNEKSSDNEEEHEEVFTLGRMSTRSQTRVSQYFTNTEVEEETSSNDDNGDSDKGSKTDFDPSDDDDNDFNQEIDGDLDIADENIV